MKKRLILLALAGFLFFGCATVQKREDLFTSLRRMVREQRYEEVIEIISGEQRKTLYNEKSKLLYYLDLGTLHHYAGNYEESNQYLTEAEYLIEELYTKSVSNVIESLLTNDNALPYAGEDYENLYTNIFKAINYIKLNDFDGAFVEIRRLNNKLNLLEDKYRELAKKYNNTGKMVKQADIGEINFHNSALGRYLSHLIYEAEGKYDDAEFDLKMMKTAFEEQPALYDFEMPDVSENEETDKQCVSILCFGGPAPVKDFDTYRIKSERNLLLIARFTSKDTRRGKTVNLAPIPVPGIESGYYSKFEIPYMKMRKSEIASIRVAVDGTPYNQARLVESVNKIAVNTFEVKKDLIYLKTITRAVLKGIGSTAASSAVTRASGSGLLGGLTSIILGAATEVTEKADLRISRFFPGRFYLHEIFLEEGTHSIKLDYLDDSGRVIYTDNIDNFQIDDEKVNLVCSYFLD